MANQVDFTKKRLYKIRDVFVVLAKKEYLPALKRELYANRIESKTYIDTCNAFFDANPYILDNATFYTIVTNNDGKVLMVGNPFLNEKMEALFKKIIANERKRQ